MVNVHTRFHAARFAPTKEAAAGADTFWDAWLLPNSGPRNITMDMGGGEFFSDEWRGEPWGLGITPHYEGRARSRASTIGEPNGPIHVAPRLIQLANPHSGNFMISAELSRVLNTGCPLTQGPITEFLQSCPLT